MKLPSSRITVVAPILATLFIAWSLYLLVDVWGKRALVELNVAQIRQIYGLMEGIRDLEEYVFTEAGGVVSEERSDGWQKAFAEYESRLADMRAAYSDFSDLTPALDFVDDRVQFLKQVRDETLSQDPDTRDVLYLGTTFRGAEREAELRLEGSIQACRGRLNVLSADLNHDWDSLTIVVIVSCLLAVFSGGLVIVYQRENSARRRTQARLQESREQLQSLASEMSLAEERERRRISAEVHDQVIQLLGVLMLRLNLLRGKNAADAAELDEVHDLLGQTLNAARSLIFELSPPVLYELGFVPAVEWLAESAQKQHGLSCSVENDYFEKPLSDDVRVVMFQAVRELLANVAKHAEAENVKIRVSKNGSFVHVSVADDGVGFDPASAESSSDDGGFGLFSIRERLGLLGGGMEIETEPGEGTVAILSAPLAVDSPVTEPSRSSTG